MTQARPQPMTPAPDMVRDAVLDALTEHGVSLRALARHTGLDKGHLSRWLQGQAGLTTGRAARCLAALGLSVGIPADPSQDGNE